MEKQRLKKGKGGGLFRILKSVQTHVGRIVEEEIRKRVKTFVS